MKVGIITNRINFKNSETPVRLTDEEKAGIKAKAKDFEDKLIKLGQDGFVKQHKDVRKEHVGLYCKARYAIVGDDWKFDGDPKFQTPEKRFQYLLRKAKKYQTDEAIDGFTDSKTDEFKQTVKHLKTKIEDLKKQLKDAETTLNTLVTNRTSEIKSATMAWMSQKVHDLEKLFKESQELSPRDKELKEDLKSSK